MVIGRALSSLTVRGVIFLYQYIEVRRQYTPVVIGRRFSPLKGRVISVSLSDSIINEVRSIQTIYSAVVIGRALSSLTVRGVFSVSISDNIINEVRSLQTIYSLVVIPLALDGAGCDFCLYIGQYNQRSKKLTKNYQYWEGTLVLDGAGCDFSLYIGLYYQRSTKPTNNILTCGNWEGTLVLDGEGCDFCTYIGQCI